MRQCESSSRDPLCHLKGQVIHEKTKWVGEKRCGHNDLTGYAGEFVTWEQKVRVSKDTWNKILTCSLLPTSLLKNSCSILLQHLLFRLWTQVINKTRVRTTLFWVWRKGKSDTTQLYAWNSDVVSQLRLAYKFLQPTPYWTIIQTF